LSLAEQSGLVAEAIMFESRISDFLPSADLTPAVAEFAPAFVACPMPLISVFSPVQQSYVAEVYRRAQELTQAQLRPQAPVRRFVSEFSLN
jgi:hypothetical protein